MSNQFTGEVLGVLLKKRGTSTTGAKSNSSIVLWPVPSYDTLKTSEMEIGRKFSQGDVSEHRIYLRAFCAINFSTLYSFGDFKVCEECKVKIVTLVQRGGF